MNIPIIELEGLLGRSGRTGIGGAAESLLKFAGTLVDDDLQEYLQGVIETRSSVKF